MVKFIKIASVSAVLASLFAASAPALASNGSHKVPSGHWLVAAGPRGTAHWVNAPETMAMVGMAQAIELVSAKVG